MNQPICRPHYRYPREIKPSKWGMRFGLLLCLLSSIFTIWVIITLWSTLTKDEREEVVEIPVSLYQEQMDMIRKLQQAVDLIQHQNKDLREYNAIQKQMIQAKNGVIPHGNR